MLLLSTSSFRWYGLHRIFSFAKTAGYDGINLDLNPADFDTENPEYIAALVKEFEVPVVSITAYERRMSVKSVDRIVEMAHMLDVKIINFYPPHRLDRDGEWFSDYLPKAKDRNKDIVFSVINVEPKTFLFFISEYKDATLQSVKKVTGQTSLSIANVDPESGTDLIKTFSVLGNSIRNVYLSDKSGDKEWLALGKGDMPLESLLIKLKEAGYKGYFTLRLSPKEMGVGEDESVLKHLEAGKKFLEKHF